MDSLRHLADQLPRRSNSASNTRQHRQQTAAEAELQACFKASAQSLVTLLKAAQNTSKRAYQAGYSTALEDVLEYLQQGLDIHQGQPSEGLAEVIDYIEARQEAIRLDGSEMDGEDDELQQQQQQSHQRQQQTLQQHSRQQSQPARHTAQQQQQQHKRQGTRSLSPIGPRSSTAAGRSVSIASTSNPGLIPFDNTPSTSTATIQQHQPRNMLQSSSAPNSPDYRNASTSIRNDSFNYSCPPSSVSTLADVSQMASHSPTHSAATPPASDAGQAGSPLTRLQARRGKDKERRMPHHRNSSLAQGHASESLPSHHAGAGTKRRWTSSLLPDLHAGMALPLPTTTEHSINLDDTSSDGSSASNKREEAGGGGESQRDVEMDHTSENWRTDGNARPFKRVVRR